MLMVYFVGHAIFRDDGHLYLSLAGTESEDPEDTSLPYEQIRREVLASRAELKIVILDCPYAGRTIEAVPESPLTDETGIYAAYVLTSTDYAAATENGSSATPFTAELIRTIRAGVPGGPADLALDDLYDPLRRRLGQRGQPEPNCQVSGRAGQLAFTRNAARDPRRGAGTEGEFPSPPRQFPSRRQLLVAGGIVAVTGATATVAIEDFPDRAEPRRPRHETRTIAWRGRPVDGPADRVYGLAFSPDGTRLAGGSADGNAWLWDVRNPRAPARHLRQGSTVYGVAFSRDGRGLATGSADGLVQLWDLETSRAQRIARHSSTVWQVAFSEDGETLASSSSDGSVTLSPVRRDGKRIVLPHRRTVFSVTFDPAGTGQDGYGSDLQFQVRGALTESNRRPSPYHGVVATAHHDLCQERPAASDLAPLLCRRLSGDARLSPRRQPVRFAACTWVRSHLRRFLRTRAVRRLSRRRGRTGQLSPRPGTPATRPNSASVS